MEERNGGCLTTGAAVSTAAQRSGRIGAGLMAVFLLGFGADTIKNLLTPRQ